MIRNEIYYADLNPTVGSETKKKRPVLIVSNNANNKASSTLTIVPITSNVKKIFPFEVFISAKDSGLAKDSKAQCHQVRTISRLRIKNIKAAGRINKDLMRQVGAALKLHLDL